jgi:hypothetical protein
MFPTFKVRFIYVLHCTFDRETPGGLELLTDPQIISDPCAVHLYSSFISEMDIRDLGMTLFGDGNTNYAALAKDHQCNEFCDFYCVPKAILRQDKPVSVEEHPSPRSITPTARNEIPPGLSHVWGPSSSTTEGSKLPNPASSNDIVDLTGSQADSEDLYM